ncbi:MAG: zinc ABC transporter substrate-binding protein [bacterium]
MTPTRTGLLSTISLLCFLLAAGAAASERPLIYVGLPPQRWLVQQLAGDRVQVGLLLSPGQNPHTFEPTARQVGDLAAARCYLMMGLPFERALVKKIQATNPSLLVRDVAAGVPRRMAPRHVRHPGDAEDADGCSEGADPHVWLTPAAMAILASNTVAALSACDPAGRGTYEARLMLLREQCARLDVELRTLLAPVRGGVMLSYHASWGYFTDAYVLRQVAIETEGRAPAARQLAALIDLAKQEKVRRIFLEPPYDPRPGQTLARQIHAEVVIIDPLAEDWDTNLRRIAEQVRAALAPP